VGRIGGSQAAPGYSAGASDARDDFTRLSRRALAADAQSTRTQAARAARALGTLLMTTPRAGDADVWPALPYASWKSTLDTLHIWAQIVGKVKLALTPFLNDWWNVTFAVNARGLTTSSIPYGQRVFQVDFDFIDHRLTIHTSDGRSLSTRLRPRAVADLSNA